MSEAKKKKKIYVPKVVNGVETMVEIEVDDTGQSSWPERSQLKLLNHKLTRVEGPEKVTGKAVYSHDVRVPGMLYGRILLSPYARATITKVDDSAARALPGVKAVVVINKKDLRFQGDPVAAVAATTPELAEDALRAIVVSYQPQPFCVDPLQAIAGQAPPVLPEGNLKVAEQKGERGAVEAALKGCHAVAEGEYRTSVQHHCCLETHGLVVDYRGGDSATVYASTQGTFTIPKDAATKLGLKPEQVTSIVHHMGGGFGSKWGLDVPGDLACQLSKQAKAPVHLLLTRQDEFLVAGNRSASLQRLKIGADQQGNLVALVAQQYRLGGLGLGSQRSQPFIYKVAQVYREVTSVHTNWDSSRAMRAPGTPQASFAIESILDDLAYKLDMDPLVLRKKNADQKYHHQIDRGAEAIGWAKGRNPRPGQGQKGPFKRGMGMGLSQWGGGGGPNCVVTLRLAADGKLAVSVGTQDLGTGTRTYTRAIVAEILGVPLEWVTPHIGESTLGKASGSGGSTTTASLAPAVKDAADNLRQLLLTRVATGWGCKPEEVSLADGRVQGPAGKSMSWQEASSAGELAAQGEWRSGLSDNGTQGVQFAEVEVDVETGKVRVLRLVGLHNCGLPLNLLAIESQINGGMIFGLGLALLEGKVTDRASGRMLNADFGDYKLAGCLEMPEFIPIIDEADTRSAVVGVAEPCVVPTAGAIANAIMNACGARVRSLPITPDKVLAELRKA